MLTMAFNVQNTEKNLNQFVFIELSFGAIKCILFHLSATKMSFRTWQLVEHTNRHSTLAVQCAQQTDESITLSSQINKKFTYSVIGIIIACCVYYMKNEVD